jgi:5'-nucleotidase / UDP-sugar diphosphatase
VDPQASYRVLVNDYMYAGGDGYAFATYDPDAYMTGIDWRQPVIEWISQLDTSPQNPLEAFLDDGAR